MTPIDQISARPSTVRELRTCSGAMYPGDPRTAALWVSSVLARPCSLEMPKSSTLMIAPPSVRSARKRFPGLRSRCTTPARWAWAMAASAWST